MEVAARAARVADLSALVALVAAGVDAVRGQKGADLWLAEEAPHPPFDHAIRRLLDEPEARVIAGCVDDVPVGILLADRRTLPDTRSVARIAFIFVHADARGIGIGEALVDDAIGWARRSGCVGIDGLALPGDREVKNLYERSGLTARAIVVHRAVEES